MCVCKCVCVCVGVSINDVAAVLMGKGNPKDHKFLLQMCVCAMFVCVFQFVCTCIIMMSVHFGAWLSSNYKRSYCKVLSLFCCCVCSDFQGILQGVGRREH